MENRFIADLKERIHKGLACPNDILALAHIDAIVAAVMRSWQYGSSSWADMLLQLAVRQTVRCQDLLGEKLVAFQNAPHPSIKLGEVVKLPVSLMPPFRVVQNLDGSGCHLLCGGEFNVDTDSQEFLEFIAHLLNVVYPTISPV